LKSVIRSGISTSARRASAFAGSVSAYSCAKRRRYF
jgi:hypothetical protein